MAHEFLFELGLEEMPAHTVRPSIEQLVQKTEAFLKESRLAFQTIHSFATPRRLAIRIEGLAEQQPDMSEEMKGPAKKIALDDAGNWSKAAIGFAKGQGASPEEIIFKELKGVEYAYVVKATKGKTAAEILPELQKIVEGLTFNVSMRWADKPFKFIRPIHWVVALLDDTVLPMQIFDIKADRKSKGHRFLGHDITIKNATSYQDDLAAEFVIADMEARKQMIRTQINELAAENNWQVSIDDDLLEEVTNLVEFPTTFAGNFAEKYLSIPDAVLITSMKDHQRYFYVQDQQGKLLPHFIGIRNGDKAHLDNVIAGNEKVLTARLEDANFFYLDDQTHTIEDYVERLKKVTFHDKIGTMYEKMQRVQVIAPIFAEIVGLDAEENEALKRAVEIYKFDLVTGMVGEFAELQGTIGEIYARKMGESEAVAKAIGEQYMPISSEGTLPQTNVGAVLALADKYDSLASFFAVGIIPTGSNDPYALRRQAYGIVRIIEDRKWHFPINDVQNKLQKALEAAKATFDLDFGIQDAAIEDFFKDRVRQAFSSQEMRRDIVDAVLDTSSIDVLMMFSAAEVLEKHIEEPDFKPTVEALTRVMRLAEKAVDSGQELVVNPDLFENDSEKALYAGVQKVQKTMTSGTLEDEYQGLRELRPLIENYFDETMIMAEDQAVQDNRLTQLLIISNLVMDLGDFNQLLVK